MKQASYTRLAEDFAGVAGRLWRDVPLRNLFLGPLVAAFLPDKYVDRWMYHAIGRYLDHK